MVRKGFAPGQITNKLREAEIHINQGISIASDLDDFLTKMSRLKDTVARWQVSTLCAG
jgi:hypothetical protein